MKTSQLMAGASRFAHFAGLSRRPRASDEGDDDQPKGKTSKASDDDDDDDRGDDQTKGKRSRASDDDDDDQPKGKKSKASDDDDDDDHRDDQAKGKRSRASDDDDDDQPKGKTSKASDDDDDEDDDVDDDKEEMSGRSAKASARLREQQRIAAILSNKAAARNLALAVSLACETRMTRLEAINVLRGQPERDDSDDGDRHQNRHARGDRQQRNVNLGSDTAAPSGTKAVAASWDTAFKRAGIKTR